MSRYHHQIRLSLNQSGGLVPYMQLIGTMDFILIRAQQIEQDFRIDLTLLCQSAKSSFIDMELLVQTLKDFTLVIALSLMKVFITTLLQTLSGV